MTDKIKKQLCELAGEKIPAICNFLEGGISHFEPKLEILIKAMWAINRLCRDRGFDGYAIKRNDYLNGYNIYLDKDFVDVIYDENHNNSETQALTAALEYVLENK